MKKFNKWMKDPEFKENYEKFKNEDKSFLKNLKNPNAEKNYETNMRKKMVENAELDKNLKDKGITKPSNWNEMGASEKDLWYDSAKKTAEKTNSNRANSSTKIKQQRQTAKSNYKEVLDFNKDKTDADWERLHSELPKEYQKRLKDE